MHARLRVAPRTPGAPGRPGRLWIGSRRGSRPGIELGACIPRGLQFRERGVALPHPLVVDAVGRSPCVGLVDLDRLFLEWERLLLEQHVVGLALFRREGWRSL